MYILTCMSTLLGTDASGQKLVQVKSLTPGDGVQLIDIGSAEIERLGASSAEAGKRGPTIPNGPLAEFAYVKADTPGLFHLFKGGFLCAMPDFRMVADRKAAAAWETFKFVDAAAAANYLRIHGQREEAFAQRVRRMNEEKVPVCLHFGCGGRQIKGFLNIDKNLDFMISATVAFGQNQDDRFFFDFADKAWPIPDGSVDYIYSEDFLEHIPQRSQIAFLAEAFRVLKSGGYNRVNTPCLAASMKRHSDFSKGRAGVYFGEFDNWGHVALVTRGFMDDIGRAIGYRQVFFTAKNSGSSRYAVEDTRPQTDRDQDTGNVYVDFLK